MGKIRTRIVGDLDLEKKQKEEQKKRSEEKKSEKKKIHLSGMKGGERMVAVEADEDSLEKMEKAKKILEEKKEIKKPEIKKLRKKTRGKNYQDAKKLIDKKKAYSLEEAVSLLKKIKYTDFDESVELHLNVDEVGLKGEVELPYPTGKSVKVKIVDDKFIEELEKSSDKVKFDFNVLVTHPSYMPKLTKFAKILGPKGLMPNPKAGTISTTPEEVVKKFQKGVLRWKTEPKFPLIHQMIGKISMEEKKLVENAKKFIQSVKTSHIKKAFIKTTMSPSIMIDIKQLA